MTWDEQANALSSPFSPDVISWRVGATNKKARERETNDPKARPTKGIAMAYIDSRDLMDRLDRVLGPAGWQARYSHAERKTVCEIGVRVNDEWIWKANGAGDTDMEAEKGALSDAFKRAGVMWGVGRYLYDIKAPWVKLDERGQIDHSELPRLMALLQPDALNTGSPPAGVGEKSAYAAKKDGQWDVVVGAFRMSASLDMLMEAAAVHKDTIALWPGDWKTELRTIYDERKAELTAREAA